MLAVDRHLLRSRGNNPCCGVLGCTGGRNALVILALVHRGHAVIDRRDGHRCSFVRQAQRLESSQSFFTNQVALLPQAGVLAILHEAQRHVILDQRGVLRGRALVVDGQRPAAVGDRAVIDHPPGEAGIDQVLNGGPGARSVVKTVMPAEQTSTMGGTSPRSCERDAAWRRIDRNAGWRP